MAKGQFSDTQLSLLMDLGIDPERFNRGLSEAVIASTNAAKKMVKEFQAVQSTLDKLKASSPSALYEKTGGSATDVFSKTQSGTYSYRGEELKYGGKALSGTTAMSRQRMWDAAEKIYAEEENKLLRTIRGTKRQATGAVLDIGRTSELDKFKNIQSSLNEKWSVKDKIGFNSSQYNRALLEAGKAAGVAGKELEGMMKKADGAGSSMGKIFKRAMETVPVWMAIRTGVQFVTQSFQQLISAAFDWQSEMAGIKIVAKGSAEEYDQLSSKMLRLGAVYGVQMKQLGEGARLWAQQGKTISEIIPLMETTIKLSMLSGKTLVDSASAITAIMKNYGIEAEKTGVIVDKLVKIDLEHAVTVDVLVDAMKRAGPQAAQMGISFDKLLGIITATHVATRASGDQIGNAWKTIFARISTSAIGAIQDLAKVPVYLKDMKPTTEQTTKFRDWGTILDEVALSYVAMDEVQKQAFGKQLGQLRQINLITSAFQQWEEGIKATVESIGAFGTAETAMNILLGTTESKMNQLTASWNELGVSIIENGEFIKDGIDMLKELVQGINDLNLLYAKGSVGREKYWSSLNNQYSEERIKTRNKEMSQIEAYNNLLKEQGKLTEWQSRISASDDSNKEKKLKILSDREKFLQEQISKAGEAKLFNGTQLKDANLDTTDMKAYNQWDTEKIENNNKKVVVAIKLQKELDEAKQKAYENSIKTPFSFVTSWVDVFGGSFDKLSDKTLPELQKQLVQLKNMANKGLIGQETVTDFEKLISLEEDFQNIEKRAPGSDSTYYTDYVKNQEDMKKLEDEERMKTNGETSDQVKFDRELKFLEARKSLGYSDLEIAKMKLDLYEEYSDKSIENLSKLKEDEIVNRDILLLMKERKDLIDYEGLMTNSLIAQGYSKLQIEKINLLLIKDRHKAEKEASQEEMDAVIAIAKLRQDSINEYSNTLKSSMSGEIKDVLTGEQDSGNMFKNIGTGMKDQFMGVVSEGLTNKLFQMTGLGNLWGNLLNTTKEGFEKTGNPVVDSLESTIHTDLINIQNAILNGNKEGINQLTSLATGPTRQAGGSGGLGGILGGLGSMFSNVFGGAGTAEIRGGATAVKTAPANYYNRTSSGGSGGAFGGGGVLGTGISAAAIASLALSIGWSEASKHPTNWSGNTNMSSGQQTTADTMSMQGNVGLNLGNWVYRSPRFQAVMGIDDETGKKLQGVNNLFDMLGGTGVVINTFARWKRIAMTTTGEEQVGEDNIVASKIDVTNKNLEIINRNLIALKSSMETFILPQSAYYSEKFNMSAEWSIYSKRGFQG